MCLRRRLELWSPRTDLCYLFSRRRINDRDPHKGMTPLGSWRTSPAIRTEEENYRAAEALQTQTVEAGPTPGRSPSRKCPHSPTESHLGWRTRSAQSRVSLLSTGSFRVSILSCLFKMGFVHTWGPPWSFCLKCNFGGLTPRGMEQAPQWLWWRCSLALQLVPRDGSPVCYMISHFTSNIPVLHAAFSNLYPTLSIIPEINMLKEVIISSTKAYVALGSQTAFLKAVIFLLQCRPGIGFEWKYGWDQRSVNYGYCWELLFIHWTSIY